MNLSMSRLIITYLISIGITTLNLSPANAARIVAALFTGFSASSDDQSGMDLLNMDLQNYLGSNPNIPLEQD